MWLRWTQRRQWHRTHAIKAACSFQIQRERAVPLGADDGGWSRTPTLPLVRSGGGEGEREGERERPTHDQSLYWGPGCYPSSFPTRVLIGGDRTGGLRVRGGRL